MRQIRLKGRPEQRRKMKLNGIPYEFKGNELRGDIPENIIDTLLVLTDERGKPLFEAINVDSPGDAEIEAALGVQLNWRLWR